MLLQIAVRDIGQLTDLLAAARDPARAGINEIKLRWNRVPG
jgi:hypothetical protein